MVIVKKAVDRVVKSGHVILCHDIEGLWIGDGGVWFFCARRAENDGDGIPQPV